MAKDNILSSTDDAMEVVFTIEAIPTIINLNHAIIQAFPNSKFDRVKNILSIGYPGFSGLMKYVIRDQVPNYRASSGYHNFITMESEFVGGSSGGPWTVEINHGGRKGKKSYIIGLNSNNNHRKTPTKMNSPYFGEKVRSVFIIVGKKVLPD